MELRELTLNDVEELLKITCHPEVTKYTPNVIQDRDTLVSWLKSKPSTDREYMILLDERVIGECSLDEKSGYIGIMLYPEYWRQGYGTAAVKQLLQMAEDAGLDEVSAQTDRRNEACIALLEGVGFARCGMGWSLSEDDLEKPLNDLQEILIFKRSLGKNREANKCQSVCGDRLADIAKRDVRRWIGDNPQ